MSGPRLLLAGDAGTGWEALGRWAAQAFALPGGHAEPASAAMADAALRAHPADRLLYFAGRPEHALRGEAGADPAPALAAWAERARAVLRVVHAHPGRCLLVDVDDARQRPDDLLAGVADWLEAAPRPAAPAPAVDAGGDDALWRLAASACVESRAGLADLAQEWLASCIPLGPALVPAAAQADAALQALLRLRSERDTAATALQRTRAELDEQTRLHAEQSVWARALERDVQRAEEALAALDAEFTRQRSAHDAEQVLRQQLEADLVLQRTQIDQLLEDNDAQAGEQARAQAEAQALRAELGDNAHRLAAVTDELDHVRGQRQALADELRAAQAAQADQAARLAAANDELQQAQAQRHALAESLQAAQTALDQHRLAHAALQGEHESLMAQLLQANTDAAAARALANDELQQAQAQRHALAESLQAAQAALDQHRLAHAALQGEHESLMAQLLQAHSDAAAARALATAPAAAAAGAAAPGATELPLPLAGIALAHVRDDPPHREAHFQLSGVLTPHGEWPELDVRLVDHQGRPGLVVFGDEARPPFSGWRRTGDEAGRGYMLIIPTDVSGPAALAPLPASDWSFVRRLADLLLLAVEEPDFGLRPAWRQVAARLAMQLDGLPPRLRYDALDVQAAADGAWQVRLGGVAWGTRSLPDLTLHWRPEGAHGPDPARCALAWRLPDDPDAAPPLTLWPEAEDGSLLPAWALAVGPGFDAAARRRWWAAQPAADRELLLAVLDALPAAADAAGQPAWRSAAAALHAEARQTLRALRLRAIVRRLRRR